MSAPRPPRRPARRARPLRPRDEAVGGLDADIRAEQAANLARVTGALAEALAAWSRLEDRHDRAEERDRALDVVSRAAWHVVVQRESLGLAGDHVAWVREHHDVPEAALARFGTAATLREPDGGRAHDGIPPLGGLGPWARP